MRATIAIDGLSRIDIAKRMAEYNSYFVSNK
jgi:hypothetical protein